jgi:hypothetical protein
LSSGEVEGSHVPAGSVLTVFFNVQTRDALILGDDRSVRVWQGNSIIFVSIFCHISMRGTTLIIEESQVDGVSIGRAAVGANVVLSIPTGKSSRQVVSSGPATCRRVSSVYVPAVLVVLVVVVVVVVAILVLHLCRDKRTMDEN